MQEIVEEHMRWVLSLCVPSRFEERASYSEDSPSPPYPRTGPKHASTFDEVMSLALDDPNEENEEDAEEKRVSVTSSDDGLEVSSHSKAPTIVLTTASPRLEMTHPIPIPSLKLTHHEAIIALSRTASTNSIASNSSIDGRMTTDYGILTPRSYGILTPRSSSLPGVTLRSNIKRMLSGSGGSSKSKGRGESRISETDDTERGGMTVLLMSQEMALKGNEVAFLRRFTSTQVLSRSQL